MRIIAVTGGIAAGKSTVTRLLAEELGCPWCSCDVIVHELLRTEPILAWLRRRFPEVITEQGAVDRRLLGDRVFGCPKDRGELEGVLHPLVLERVEEWVRIHESATIRGVVEVPLLYEVDFPLKRDVDVAVACSERKQIERLARRDGSAARDRNRIAAQMPLPEKIGRAEVVIWNEGSLGTLSRLVALAARRIQQKTQ